MKADFEKGTKICCRCKKELPLDMFYKDKSRNDGLCCCCKNVAMNIVRRIVQVIEEENIKKYIAIKEITHSDE